MEIREYARPKSMDEAMHLIHEEHGTAIGGSAWLRTNTKTVMLGVDLSDLGLEYIREFQDHIEIGAMTTYRELETSLLLASRFGKIFSTAVGHIVGIQLRSIITVGGTVAGRYGFSDLNTTLCALGARVVFYPNIEEDLASFIEKGYAGPFLIEKIILPSSARAAYQQMRISENDFPIINTAVAWTGTEWRVAAGSRPAAARLCRNAMKILADSANPSNEQIEAAAQESSKELQFGSDIRASATYRQKILPVLVRRALLEVRG